MIKSVELNYFAIFGDPIFCLYCGKQIFNPNAVFPDEKGEYEKGEYFNPCPHVIFWAGDDGYEYKNESFKDVLPPFDIDLDPLEDPNDPLHLFVNRILETKDLPDDSLMIEMYSPSPSFAGHYMGFSSMVDLSQWGIPPSRKPIV